MPPSGFLISWARFLISSLVASACSRARSSRSWRFCCSISTSSKTTFLEPSIWFTVTCTGSTSPGAADGRFSSASSRLVEKALLLTATTVSRSTCASTNQSKTSAARHRPARQAEDVLERRVGELAFAFRRDHGDHRRQQVERGLGRRVACRRPRRWRRRGRRDHGCGGGSFLISRWIAAMSTCLRAIAARMSLDPVEVLLVVLLVAQALGLAVVEFLLHRGELVLFGLQLSLEDAAGIAVARPLRHRIDADAAGAGRRDCRCPGAAWSSG